MFSFMHFWSETILEKFVDHMISLARRKAVFEYHVKVRMQLQKGSHPIVPRFQVIWSKSAVCLYFSFLPQIATFKVNLHFLTTCDMYLVSPKLLLLQFFTTRILNLQHKIVYIGILSQISKMCLQFWAMWAVRAVRAVRQI